tara:strand:+ start:100 stop:699 length:600 start_codon:yes stop_codon:yes gene_type:complete
MHISMTQLPQCVINAAASDGHKRADIKAVECDAVSPFYPADAGSRGVCILVDLETGSKTKSYGSWGGANMFVNPPVDSLDCPVPIPEGHVVLKGSTGNLNLLTLYARAEFLSQFEEDELPELTEREATVLWAHRNCKSSYRKDHYYSRGLTTAQLDIAKTGLELKGLLKIAKNGASKLTTAGRNASDGMPHLEPSGIIA